MQLDYLLSANCVRPNKCSRLLIFFITVRARECTSMSTSCRDKRARIPAINISSALRCSIPRGVIP